MKHLHLYLGQQCIITKSIPREGFAKVGEIVTISGVLVDLVNSSQMEVTPLLTPMEKMSEEQMKELLSLNMSCKIDELECVSSKGFSRQYLLDITTVTPAQVIYCLSQGLDILGDIKAGRAKEKV